MKKYAIFYAAALLLLTACGASENSGTDVPSPDANPGVTEVAEPAAGTETTGAPYVFTASGTDIVIDAEAAPILAALGDAASYYEAASCAFEGLDKYYTYGSYEVDTYPDESGVDRISAVLLKDDLVSTAEGVSIGSSREDVAAAYGEGAEEGASLVYEKGGMKLMFILDSDGAVESIQYLTKALDAVATEAG
ncbi:MAG: hypothetical protein IJT94_02725 [Oscillibacter sp.]|nr:hypothetical protein [Oscillibacter sp.]